MSKAFAMAAKIVTWPVSHFYFKKKVYYEDSNQPKKIKGPALIVSNHKSVMDYVLAMYTFMPRHIYCLIGEGVYKKKGLAFLAKAMGNIKVSRLDKDFSFMTKTINLLKKGNMCLIFPEARLHKEDEDPNQLLPFTSSFVHIALSANVPIIPVYTNGIYGSKKKQYKSRAKIIVGKKIDLNSLMDSSLSYDNNIKNITQYIQKYIEELGKKVEAHEQTS